MWPYFNEVSLVIFWAWVSPSLIWEKESRSVIFKVFKNSNSLKAGHIPSLTGIHCSRSSQWGGSGRGPGSLIELGPEDSDITSIHYVRSVGFQIVYWGYIGWKCLSFFGPSLHVSIHPSSTREGILWSFDRVGLHVRFHSKKKKKTKHKPKTTTALFWMV